MPAALAAQRGMAAAARGREPLRFRIGINLGDVIADGDDILGDGVNVAARLEALAEPGGTSAIAAPADDRPSVVMLPFRNASADPEQAWFANGVAEDITAELSRFSDLMVISDGAQAAPEGPHEDARAAAARHGARFVLEGAVRRAGSRVRISLALSEGGSGRRIWSERREGDLGDTFGMQDAMARLVVDLEAGMRLAGG